MSEREKIQQSVAALEAQRALLGDAVVEPAIAALKQQIVALDTQQSIPHHQRKYVTVLFADVSGFTAMSETLDAEEVSEIMNALWQQLDVAITHYNGYIDKHIGDAIMALFGVEEAHEDDPERAIEAALAMQTELQVFNGQHPDRPVLNMRIGINTGGVLLGEVGTTSEFTAMGDTVNFASRLEHAAPIGGILISHNTYRHVRGVFEVTPQEPLTVKGKQVPIQTYVVIQKKPRAFRIMTRGVEGIETRMIGRDEELRHLQDTFYTIIEDQEMEMITIAGEAGIGKSRLLYEFENWLDLQPEDCYIFKGRASEQTRNLPYFLIRDLFAFRFQIAESDPLEVVHEKLEQGIVEFMGAGCEEQAHFIGHLLGYHYTDSPYLRGILEDSKQIRNIALHYLMQFFVAVTKGMHAVILLEDLHWADDGSLDVIQHLTQECRQVPILIMGCTRPPLFERRPLWGEGQEQHIRLDLHPLSKQDSRRLVREILQNVTEIPTELRDLIVNGAEGNPFYVEELIKMLIEENVIIKEEEQWRVETKRLAEIKVPPTLTGVLQARLDSLPMTERDVLKRASVIGRVFWDNALDSMRILSSELPQPPSTQETLQTLRSRELIFEREASSFEDTHEYIFKHAILRDVTYESVLLRQRRELHAQAAAWLIEKSGAQVEHYAGLIGEHYEKARRLANAVEWYGRAAKQAQDAYAPETAIDYYQRALKLLDDDQISEVLKTSEVYAQRIKLYPGLGEVLNTRARYEEAIEASTAMLTAAEAIVDASAQARAWNGLAWTQSLQGDSRASLESAKRAEAIARTVGVAIQTELLTALHWKGIAFWRIGDAERALALAEETLVRSTELDAKQEMIHSLSLFGVVNNMLGRYDQAVSYQEKALAICQELGNRQRVADMLNGLAETARMRGDYQSALNGYLEALTIARKIEDRDGEIVFLSNIGGTKVELGEYAAAEADLRQVIEMVGNTRILLLSETNYFLTRVCLRQGKVEEALAAAQQALTLAQEFEDPFFLGSAWQVLGQVAVGVSSVRIGEVDYTAAECFAESLRVFKESKMEGYQAHTLKAWAEYELRQGDWTKGETLWREAREILNAWKCH
jgi:predicted ATPase/class 3 adenylate cyclase